MTFILANWKLILIGVILSYAGIVTWVADERGKAIESMKITIAQFAKSQEQCVKDKKLTEDTSHDYQDRLKSVTARINALKLHQPTKCVMPVTSTPTGRISAPRGTKPTRTNGVTTSALYDIAGKGEKYRLQLKACQDFVNKVWERAIPSGQ